jgi:very-short-patch-repair endonuclease
LCRNKSRYRIGRAHHQLNEQKEYDKNRTEFLEELGIRIIRILNQEVLSSKENVLRKIIAFTNSPPPSHS